MCQWEGSNNAPTLADNSFDGVEFTAHHHGYMGECQVLCVKEFAVATFDQSSVCWGWTAIQILYETGPGWVGEEPSTFSC